MVIVYNDLLAREFLHDSMARLYILHKFERKKEKRERKEKLSATTEAFLTARMSFK